MNYSKSIQNAFQQRQSLIILGLTGRTGSGCSTTSKILSSKNFSDLSIRTPKSRDYLSRDERKYEIVYKYMQTEGKWSPFTIIEGSSIIFSFILEAGFEPFRKFFQTHKSITDNNDIRISAYNELASTINGLEYLFCNSDSYHFDSLSQILESPEETERYYHFFIEELPKLKADFCNAIKDYTCHKEYVDKFVGTKSVKSQLYTYFMQEIGNNIRSSGNPYLSCYSEENFYDVAIRIDNIIKVIQKYSENNGIHDVRVCIDAIRNPYEAYYFKDKYSSFYLVSVNTEEDERKRRLSHLDAEELKSLDEIEFEQACSDDYNVFFHQSMQKCLSISDIHIYNPKTNDCNYHFLTEQIIKYISLMIHPGLISPSHIERCMQIAFVARANSGCLSRQVGATITGEDFSVKAIGWNEVPEGQVPCNLRCIPDYCANKDLETFSSFELQNKEFEQALSIINTAISGTDLFGMSYSYCFKDIYNAIKGTKNQVYTRSLHAEENAFLQLSKNGGQGIKGGKLFTTASPCELCAKKAFQLGIKDIFYVDPYPGISMQHILSFGTKFSPTMHLFYGAIDDAYIRLYTPRIPIKDELKLLSGVECKKVLQEHNVSPLQSFGIRDIKYESLSSKFIFKSRTDISEITTSKIVALHDNLCEIPQRAFWTGNSFNGFKINSCDRDYTFTNVEGHNNPYCAILSFATPLMEHDAASFELQIDAKDAQRVMCPYYAQLVTIQTDQLSMEVQVPIHTISNVKCSVYADIDLNKDYLVQSTPLNPTMNMDENIETYSITFDHPNLMYGYSIEWDFVDQ